MSIEWLSPWADHHGYTIHEEYIDAAVGQDPLCESVRRTDCLSPEAKQEFSEGRRRPEFAVRGNCYANIMFAIHV